MTVDLAGHQHVHFVGIAGIGMSALARFLLRKGYVVSGSDREPGEQGRALTEAGARVVAGHAATNLADADLVVISSAVPPDNPELVAARGAGIPVVKRAELLAAIMNAGTGIAVAGTHGKSTTSALIGHLLVEGGRDPTVLIGGISTNLGSNARIGDGRLVVVEADEYDASFRHLSPTVGVITNVEPDHLDFYRTVGRLHAAFRDFAAAVTGTLIVCADDPVLRFLVGGVASRIITYGTEAGEWRGEAIEEEGGKTSFRVRHAGAVDRYETPLAGVHNVRNALAAIIVADAFGLPRDTIAHGLATFAGLQRRFEIKGEVNDVLVMDDYAHHPTEVQVNLTAMKSRFNRPVRLIFQPHTYSRTHDLLDEFAGSFGEADAVYLMDIYAARETNTLGIAAADLAAAAARRHAGVRYTGTADDTLAAVLRDVQPGDLVVTMGAGDVYRLAPRILGALGPA